MMLIQQGTRERMLGLGWPGRGSCGEAFLHGNRTQAQPVKAILPTWSVAQIRLQTI